MQFARAVVALLAALVACRASQAQGNDGVIAVVPHAPSRGVVPGKSALGFGEERDGFLFVPAADTSTARGVPLLVLLHGATQRARLFERLLPLADSMGVAILAPDSREMTWDAIRGTFGPDIAFMERAISYAFDHARIDRCRVVIGGFSDGASYALSLGIRNSRSFHGVVAFSPGFVIPTALPEKIPVFERHGTRDQILPIEATSRRIVPALREAGFQVDYQEFDGPHTMRAEDARAAMTWASQRSC
jgi:phospholipase/carboxylesterase